MTQQENGDQPRAFEGIRVVESGRFLAGPLVGTLMGDMGADVIHVEDRVGGDPLRRAYPPPINGVGSYFLWLARNKRSITLDLRTPKGQDLFRELVAVADVVTENFTPGTMEKWGLGYEDLKKINPKVIMLSVSGWGATGPYRDRQGVDHIIQAASGMMSVSGEPDGPPTFNGIAIADWTGGFLNTYAVLTALFHRERTGQGQWIDSGLFDAASFLMENKIVHYTAMGEVAWRQGSRGVPLARAYPSKDGDVFVLAFAGRAAQLLPALGLGQFLEDPRFPKEPSEPFDRDFLDEIDAAVECWTRQHTNAEVEEFMLSIGIMCSPVNDVAAVVEHPQYIARNNLVEVEHPELGPLRFQGTAPKLSLTPGRVTRAAPLLGQDNQDIYCGLLGHTPEELETWAAEKVI